ncbi:MAG TPA: hypothetical protein VGZ03_00995 [Acidimicrobiales bacterium]|nr:hypothetical protein [Acidimicrobiales bacterium]
MAKATLSGSTYSVAAGPFGTLTLRLDGTAVQREKRMVRTKRDRFTLADFQHAGIAWFENPMANQPRGRDYFTKYPRFESFLCLWRDAKTCERLSGTLDDADEGFQQLQQRTTDGIASTPAGRFAAMLDGAIATTKASPAPDQLPGSYLPFEGRAVWIPSLGASNPF